jgi:DNA adenine methylase
MAENELFDIFQELEDLGKDEEVLTRETILKAPFGYPGGKTRSLMQILPHLPYRKSFLDVCGGAGNVILSRRPSKLEVYNDRFGGVTDFYRCIKDPVLFDKLTDWLDHTVHSREEFWFCKNTWENHQDIVERAARWYYMTMYSFGAQGRNFGRSVSHATNISGKVRARIPDFQKVHERFRNILIENQDVRVLLKDFDSEDAVFYIDPPYFGTYKEFYPTIMTEKDHVEMLDMVFKMKGFVAVSGYQNEVYKSYKWDQVLTWKCFVSSKSVAKNSNYGEDIAKMNERYEATEVLYIKE